jgi:hypothetical protein
MSAAQAVFPSFLRHRTALHTLGLWALTRCGDAERGAARHCQRHRHTLSARLLRVCRVMRIRLFVPNTENAESG